MFQIYHPESKTNLLEWSWVILSGPDAKNFLHRLTTINVNLLPIGEGHPGCFLTPQGKIRVFFILWNLGPDEYAFEFEAGPSGKWKQNLLKFLEEFTFAEKMTVTDLSTSLQWTWLFNEGSDQEHKTSPIDSGLRICHHGSLDYGRLWSTAWGDPTQLAEWLKKFYPKSPTLKLQEIESWRMQALRPRVNSEITEAVLPLEIGLRQAIADNKGCYPGQEVIEKIIALGSPPRRLVRIEGEGNAPRIGDSIYHFSTPSIVLGQITSISKQGNKYSALGLIKKIHAKEGLEVQFSTNQGATYQNSNCEKPKGAITQISSY